MGWKRAPACAVYQVCIKILERVRERFGVRLEQTSDLWQAERLLADAIKTYPDASLGGVSGASDRATCHSIF
jgi:hypothetical protein